MSKKLVPRGFVWCTLAYCHPKEPSSKPQNKECRDPFPLTISRFVLSTSYAPSSDIADPAQCAICCM
eukprot:2169496-Amphidinium_carterae.1